MFASALYCRSHVEKSDFESCATTRTIQGMARVEDNVENWGTQMEYVSDELTPSDSSTVEIMHIFYPSALSCPL